MERFMIYANEGLARGVSRAVNAQLGIPRRDHPTGPESAAEFAQARGWTTSEGSIILAQDGSGRAAYVVTEAAYALNMPGPMDFRAAVTELPPGFRGEPVP